MFYGFPGVKTVVNGRTASAPAEHPVIHDKIARKQKKIHPGIFYKWFQPFERSRKRLKKTYEVKFCFMQKEISYIRLKKRLPIKSLKITHTHTHTHTHIPYFSRYMSKRKKKFFKKYHQIGLQSAKL